ncbi:MAG: NAD(P)/FAD-dependent oxidoreductase [Micropruina sp.]
MQKTITIIGGGHNALTAAAYLARAGASVTVLERLDHVGGAALSAPAFPGVDARLSRYAYLVSLMPKQVIDDLGIPLRLARRRYSSYTPVPGTDRGLLIDNGDADATRASFASIGAAADVDGFASVYHRTGVAARALFPTLTDPLPTQAQAKELVGADWAALIERPIAELIEATVADDLVRGVIATDGLIGTYASMHDASLEQNRCFLYHVIGGGTGDWDVPIGGMGVVSTSLEGTARAAGARILTGAEVTGLTPDGEVTWRQGDAEHRLTADLVLCGAAPSVLSRLLGETPERVEGAQVKVNMLLTRLPRLRQDLSSEAAFGGTFHINESLTQLEEAFAVAGAGRIPDPLPAEIYCHSLSDPSILGPELQAKGWQTLTLFGLHLPDRLVNSYGNDELRGLLRTAVLNTLESVLAEPVEPLLARDGTGECCLEVKTTRDIEDALAMPGGNIFHNGLSWPWADADDPLDTPARRWGVESGHDGILLCGAGARRGGGVSGVGGHNAARAAIELLGL